MDFGKLADLSGVNWQLPPDDPRNALFAQQMPARSMPATLYGGATGWAMDEWKGSYYPANAKSADYLTHYSRLFNTIELNTTHYRIPNEATIEQWYSKTPAAFRFAPKVLQGISHSAQLGLNTRLIEAFAESVRGLREKLGPCFLQLPPHFAPDKLPLLAQFIERWSDTGCPLAVEFRHPLWFAGEGTRERWMELLAANRVGAVITDVAGRRDVLHQAITAPQVLIRFVGNALDPSDYRRLDDWAQRMADWRQYHLESIYFFLHQPENRLVPESMHYFANTIRKNDLYQLHAPMPMDNPQISLFG